MPRAFSTAATFDRELPASDAQTPNPAWSASAPSRCAGFACARPAARSGPVSKYLDEYLLLALPHRQFIFTLPKALRVFLRYDQRLFGWISRLMFSLIAEFYSAWAFRPISRAAILASQPFGEALRVNPHFHALILEERTTPCVCTATTPRPARRSPSTVLFG